MNSLIASLIALITATLLSGLAAGFAARGDLSFVFVPWQAAAALATALVAIIVLSALNARQPRQAGSADTPAAPASDGRSSGTVKWFNPNKGFGFITCDSGDEVFVHYRNIEGSGRRILRQDQKVSFIVTQGDKGPQAEDVRPL